MKVLITAALPYANGPLHLGHIRSTYLPADIYKRFNEIIGNEVIYVCASDEHGTPIAVEAEKQGKKPEDIVNYYHERDKKEFKELGFSMDIFHRTSSKENKEMALFFFEKLKENGYIYEKKVTQYYCEDLNRFMPDRYIKGVCPYCKAEEQYADQCEKCGKTLKPGELINPYCTITKTKPSLKEVSHYFFKLSDFKESLKDFLEKGNFQKEVINYVNNWLNDLKDWDIVRELDWGIKVPGRANQVFYVWFDAPIGYISSTKALRKDWKEFWNSSKIVHFIGKDIIYHHYLFWPAMLIGVKEFSLPYAIPTRGYLNLENKKFSKSRGWYITIREFLDNFPPDYLRYYMTYITPYSLVDANFSFEEFMHRINNDLIANYGNLVNRVGKLSNGLNLKEEYLKHGFLQLMNEFKEKYAEKMENFEFKEGLEIAMEVVKRANKLISDEEPWKLKGEFKESVMSEAVYATLLSSVMLYPIIPFSTKKALEMLNHKEISLSIKLPSKINKVKPLYKKVEEKDISKMKEILAKRSNENSV